MDITEIESKLAVAVKECKDYKQNNQKLVNPKIEEFISNWEIGLTEENNEKINFKVNVRLSRNVNSESLSDLHTISGFAEKKDDEFLIIPPIYVTNFLQ